MAKRALPKQLGDVSKLQNKYMLAIMKSLRNNCECEVCKIMRSVAEDFMSQLEG